MKRLLLLTLAFFVFSYSDIRAQDAQSARCIQNLNQAEDRYAAGNLQGIGALLNSCLSGDNYSKAEKIRAYKLLTLVAIFNDNEPLAEENMINLLKADPEHEYDRILDPAEFVALYNKFRIEPIFRVGVKFGANLSETNVIASYHTNNQISDPKRYSQELGFGGELSLEREFLSNFEGVGSIGYHRRSFSWSQIAYGFGTTPPQGESSADGASLVQENQNWIDLNLGVRAFYRFGNAYPYVFAGLGFNYLLSNVEVAERGAVTTGSNVDLVETNNRKQFNYSAFGGVGLKYRIGVDFLTLEVRYVNGLTDIVNSSNRYPIPSTFETEDAVGNATPINNNRQDRLFKTGVVDDNFGVNSIMFSLGFVKSIHSPKKLKAYQ